MFSTTRKAATAAALVVALLAAVTSPSSADSKHDLEKQRKAVGGKIHDAKNQLEDSTAAYARAAAAVKRAQVKLDAAETSLSQTRGQLAVAQARDDAMQARLVRSEADLDAAIAKLASGNAQLAASEATVEQFTVDNLQQGDRGMQAFGDLLRGEDPSTFSEQMSLNDSVADAQLGTMQRLAATKVILKINRDKVRTLRDQVKVQRAQAAANLVTRKQLESSAEDQAAKVGELVTARRGARTTAAKARRQDEAVYHARVRESQRLSAQLRALAAAALRAKSKGKSDGSGGDGGGTLTRPVGGPVTSPYGMRVHPVTGVYKLHDGTDFGVACGTPVRAAASGTIIQQYYNAAYGNRVILNNGIMRGKSVVTTYNHLSRFAVRSGSRVSRGQVIAYSGTTGYSTGCHLHFMVITNGYTVDPAGWI